MEGVHRIVYVYISAAPRIHGLPAVFAHASRNPRHEPSKNTADSHFQCHQEKRQQNRDTGKNYIRTEGSYIHFTRLPSSNKIRNSPILSAKSKAPVYMTFFYSKKAPIPSRDGGYRVTTLIYLHVTIQTSSGTQIFIINTLALYRALPDEAY